MTERNWEAGDRGEGGRRREREGERGKERKEREEGGKEAGRKRGRGG